MSKLEVNKILTLKEFRAILKKERDIRLFRYWHLLYYISTVKNVTAQECSDRLALGKYNIYRIVQLYNRTGKDFINHLQWGGQRKLPYENEKKIIDKLKSRQNLYVVSLTKAVQKEFGATLPTNYIEKLVQKHKLVIPYDKRKRAKR